MEARSKGRKKQSWVFAIVGEEEKGSKWELGNGKKEVESREFVNDRLDAGVLCSWEILFDHVVF